MNETFRPRLWPAWLMMLLSVVAVGSTPFLIPRTTLHFVSMFGGLLLMPFGILVWWLVGSRARGPWRWWPVLAFLLPEAAISAALYSNPMKDLQLPLMFLAPVVAVIWIIWLTLFGRKMGLAQKQAMLVVIVAAWSLTLLVRFNGTNAELVPDLRWAWELPNSVLFERERAARTNREISPRTAIVVTPEDWPEFRGAARDNKVMSRIRTDWAANPPKQLWRQRVGAGWGSFAVVGDRIFTQEQRGGDEAVVCYDALTGTEIWEARVPGLFTEPIAKEGPRATPTVHEGRVYAFGAVGTLVALDAATGQQIWLHDVKAELGANLPMWGFASSPLVIAGNVVVFTAAKDQAVAAYRIKDGELAWAKGAGLHGYSSAQRFAFEGDEYLLMVSDFGLEAFDPKSGELRGEFAWTIRGMNRVAQPAIINEKAILIGTAVGTGQGAKRLAVSRDGSALKFTEVWTSKSPKPYFNDGVIFNGYYYGWDDRNFACIDCKNGKVKWDAGSKYGFGQVLLLPAQKLLLVQAESGAVLLVNADPEDLFEVAKFQAIDGKTWNHPVVVRGKLYVRNNVEAACYDISAVEAAKK